ncbi:MAG: SoxY-related AACIE arm protein [Ideonella sp.]|jgi:sulfur-oxidizing protein SoxY|nr:SoxY-related AACIE arm protein [Ideonella sp.]MBL0150692.1 SoxY-related AACIE arm protein [Ideonella sp.]
MSPTARRPHGRPTRRQLLAAGGLLALTMRPCAAQAMLEPELRDAIGRWCNGAVPQTGRITLDIAPLVENGNAVPVTLRVHSPMSATDHVREIAMFNERNPLRDVVRFQLGPANGRAEVSTRIRLATTQHLVALARLSDGSVWQHGLEVIVTLAACIES